MPISGPNIDIEYDPSLGGGGGSSGSGNENINYNKDYVFFKDITPDFLDSDRSDNVGFSDLNRLTYLLHSWGFSDVNVSNITEWKISSYNQYTNDGPRLEWKGNLFVRAPGLDLLKCKNKNKTSFQICTDIKEDNYILLNTHASGYSETTWKWIHISEFGFGILKNDTYLWNYKQAPFDLINPDISSKYTGDGNNSYNITSVGVIKKDYIGKLNQVVLTKFRIGENINNKEYISGYFQKDCELYPYKKENEFGYYSQLDSIYPKYKYFNLGELEVIGTNFYNRKFDFPYVRLNGNDFVFQANNQISVTRNISQYDIYLCYVPPLTLNSEYSMEAPATGRILNYNTDAIGSWRTFEEYFPTSSSLHANLSEAKYNIKLARNSSEVSGNTIPSYQSPVYYKLDINGSFSWKDCKWTKDSSINFNTIIGTKDLTLQYNLDSCYSILKSGLESSTDTEDFLYWKEQWYNRFIIKSSFEVATSCFTFSIPLRNIPYFKNDSSKHIYEYKTYGLDTESYISPGRIVGYSYNPDNGKPYVSDNAIWWSRRKHNNNIYIVSPYAELPKIDLSNQTIYRSKTSLLKDGIFGTYSCHEPKKQIAKTPWAEDEMQLAGINDTTTEGFYCLFALKKEK